MNVIIPQPASEYETQLNVSKKAANLVMKLMSAAEQEMLATIDETFNMNCDAVILYTLFKSYGFTAEQLKAFYNEVNSTLKAESKADENRVNYGIIPQRAALKDEAGVDLKAWDEEVESNG